MADAPPEGPGPGASVMRSILRADALPVTLDEWFAKGEPWECHLLHFGLSDTYRVRRGTSTYALRIYRSGAWSRDEIDFELQLLQHLHLRGLTVSVPLRRLDGAYVGQVAAPEGTRHVVLFTFAPGERPHAEPAAGHAYGRLAAAVHAAGSDFTPAAARRALDLDHLVTRSVATVCRAADHRPDDAAHVRRVAASVTAGLEALDLTRLDWGVCHGDLHFGNVRAAPREGWCLFDFDLCGYGWRAYDLAGFCYETAPEDSDGSICAAFLDGYRQIRALNDHEAAALPIFVVARHLWWMALQLQGDSFGWAWIDDFFDEHLVTLRRLASRAGLRIAGR